MADTCHKKLTDHLILYIAYWLNEEPEAADLVKKGPFSQS
jgi:hypothetical protein